MINQDPTWLTMTREHAYCGNLCCYCAKGIDAGSRFHIDKTLLSHAFCYAQEIERKYNEDWKRHEKLGPDGL